MPYAFNPFTGNLDITGSGGGVTGDITAVSAGTGLSGGGISGDVTLSLANTAVTPGSYTYAAITVDAQGRITAASSGTAPSGTVTSVALSVPVGFSVSGSPVTSSGTLALAFDTGYSLPTTGKQADWDTAYSDRLKWDGGSTGLVASTARTSLGLGTFATSDAATPPAIGGTTPAAGSFTRLTLPAQGSAPSTPASGFTFYANSSNALSWVGANGFIRTLDGTANTANRTYTLPDASGSLTLQGAITGSGLTMATARLLGRSTASTGAVEEISLPTGFGLSAGVLTAPAEIGLACSDETTALTVGTGKLTFRMPYAMTLTAVRLSVTTAPTGSALIVDVKQGGVSVFSTLPRIDASATTSVGSGTPAVISDTALADNAVITIDIDQIGSTVAGAGLKVWLIGRRA